MFSRSAESELQALRRFLLRLTESPISIDVTLAGPYGLDENELDYVIHYHQVPSQRIDLMVMAIGTMMVTIALTA